MKKTTITLAITAAVSLAALFISTTPLRAEHDHGAGHKATVPASGPSPLVDEMRRLDNVFRDVVSGVALGDGEKVHSAIEGMHGAKEKTQEALHAGAVKPPKNADKIEKFEKMDTEFHKKLEKLGLAAHKNDRKMMLSLTKELLDGCVNCHTVFRQ